MMTTVTFLDELRHNVGSKSHSYVCSGERTLIEASTALVWANLERAVITGVSCLTSAGTRLCTAFTVTTAVVWTGLDVTLDTGETLVTLAGSHGVAFTVVATGAWRALKHLAFITNKSVVAATGACLVGTLTGTTAATVVQTLSCTHAKITCIG